jgi:hypothetical protein
MAALKGVDLRLIKGMTGERNGYDHEGEKQQYSTGFGIPATAGHEPLVEVALS